jgi:hypothetical protein
MGDVGKEVCPKGKVSHFQGEPRNTFEQFSSIVAIVDVDQGFSDGEESIDAAFDSSLGVGVVDGPFEHSQPRPQGEEFVR